MPGEASAYIAILLMALATLATRLLGLAVMQRLGASERVSRFLDLLSLSVLAAIVAAALAQGGWREVAAVALAAVVMYALRNATWAMLAAMAVAALWARLWG